MTVSSLTSAIKEKETAIGERVKSSKVVSVYWPSLKAMGSKIPLRKNVLLLLGAAIFAMCLMIIVSAYMGQIDERDRLSDELSTLEGQTDSITRDSALLQQSIDDTNIQIAQLINRIAVQQEGFTVSPQVSGIIGDLLEVANDNGVEIIDGVDVTNISSTTPVSENIAGASYQAISLNMTVYATESEDIYGFVEDLSQSEEFSTGVLKTLNMSIEETFSSANILLTIYSL